MEAVNPLLVIGVVLVLRVGFAGTCIRL